MFTPARFLSVIFFAVLSLSARTRTDIQGRNIEAEFVRLSGDTVTIRRADGHVFDLPLAELSPPDRDYVTGVVAPTPAPDTKPNGSFQTINALLGVELLADENLWDDVPAGSTCRSKEKTRTSKATVPTRTNRSRCWARSPP